ncbi:dynein regulatory complex protein 9 [Neolamprologus brichardi]|uniref:dynein regulatory complex protein 9 n=1 Tax=Neolamprologus brichardi TaxID=32507 RepID=UPI0003EBEAC2|nr:dynein regulatory complex protein 9 [Neolamprologus brichardi]
MCLSRIQSLRLVAVLEDCSHQLEILGHILTMRIRRERPAQEKAKLRKLTRDCEYISQLMSKLHLELEDKQCFSSLLQAVEEVEQRRRDTNMKREEMKQVGKRRQTLLKQQEELQQKTLKLQVIHHEANKKDHLLKMRIKENTKENDTGLQLRKIQSETSQAEALLEGQLELLKKQLKEEVRVYKESQKFLLRQHEELQQLLHELQKHTEQMVQEKSKQLHNMCFKKDLNLDRLEDMKMKFKEMEQMVMEDREEQEKLHQQQARIRAATKLQAWWRGCIVRRGLCGFKKAKKGKKGNKKERKKKKK